DIGGQVAHAFALQFPQATRGVMILDTPLPGVDGWDECLANPGLWHVGFLQTPDLPETLLAGRHAPFLEHMLGFGDFEAEQVAESVKAYGSAAQLHAACEIYRAFDRNVRFTREHRGANEVPLVLGMGARSPLATLAPRIARGLRDGGFAKVEEATVADAGHFLINDLPDAVAALIERYAS
ncbi:MAG TPA: alpha/beta hydrolase, partial [Sphingomonas sp.]|nr:alpha/beta hydrolase [Sphingomonas sp.]